MEKANCKRCVLTLVLKVVGKSDRQRVFQNLGPAIENAHLPVYVLVLGMFSDESTSLVSCENVLCGLAWDFSTGVGQSATMFYRHRKISMHKI